MKKVLVILADGFEEVEALTPVDYLRRAGAEVTVAGLEKIQIQGSHNIVVKCDSILNEQHIDLWNAVILPGGMGGVTNLSNSEIVKKIIIKNFEDKNFICAICAAPAVVLGPLGILSDKKAVCYPGMENSSFNATFLTTKTAVDGNLITACGVGCSQEFSFEIIKALFGEKTAEKIMKQVVYKL